MIHNWNSFYGLNIPWWQGITASESCVTLYSLSDIPTWLPCGLKQHLSLSYNPEKLTRHHESLRHSSPFSLSSFACPRPGGHLVRILKAPPTPASLECFWLPTNACALVPFGTQFLYRGDRCGSAVVRHRLKVYKLVLAAVFGS